MNSKLLKFIKVVMVSSFIGSLIVACGDDKTSKKSHEGSQNTVIKSVPVAVETPQLETAASYYVTTATLAPSSDAQINARTTGVVEEILHEEGDDVSEGDILLILEDDDQRLRLKQAEQQLASSEREFNRLSKMKKAGAVSPNEWEAANNAFLSAQTEVELAKLALSYTKIVSPFTGRVVWREVDLGQHVSIGDLLYRVMSIKPLLVKVYVPANRVANLRKGQKIELNIDSIIKPLWGEIDLVSPIVDPTTGTVKVTAKINDYPENVRPGDFTQVKLVTDSREKAMMLPSIALIEERGQHYIYVEEAGKAKRRNVEVGYVVGQKTEILNGINLEDRVVVKGQRNLNDGNAIEIITPSSTEVKQNVQKTARKGSDS